MAAWSVGELHKIGHADELHIAPLKSDGSLPQPVTIWVVRVNEGLYVRSVRGTEGKWFARAMSSLRGRIEAGGVRRDVDFMPVSGAIQSEIDSAYHAKYDRYGAQIVGSTLTPTARAATLSLQPRD